MNRNIAFTLSFDGNNAKDHEIDFYDMAQALIGFQRSLALTTHLVLNGEIITQAPFLKGAKIIAVPPEEGSWKITAVIGMLLTGAYHVTTAPKDTMLGHLVASAYDYVVSENLGFHIDFEKTLGQQYEELKQVGTKLPILDQSKLDSLTEKCEGNIIQMHRPIAFSETAKVAKITATVSGEERPFKQPFNLTTYDYVTFTEESKESYESIGRISSYNINTFKGRIFVPEENRPIPFILSENARTARNIAHITKSLTLNAQDRFIEDGFVKFVAFKNLSRSGRLKFLYIVEVYAQ